MILLFFLITFSLQGVSQKFSYKLDQISKIETLWNQKNNIKKKDYQAWKLKIFKNFEIHFNLMDATIHKKENKEKYTTDERLKIAQLMNKIKNEENDFWKEILNNMTKRNIIPSNYFETPHVLKNFFSTKIIKKKLKFDNSENITTPKEKLKNHSIILKETDPVAERIQFEKEKIEFLPNIVEENYKKSDMNNETHKMHDPNNFEEFQLNIKKAIEALQGSPILKSFQISNENKNFHKNQEMHVETYKNPQNSLSEFEQIESPALNTIHMRTKNPSQKIHEEEKIDLIDPQLKDSTLQKNKNNDDIELIQLDDSDEFQFLENGDSDEFEFID